MPTESIWIPGRGQMVIRELQAARAVEEYASDLILGFRKDTQEWVVFKQGGPDGQPFPVFGLGRELPTPEEIQKRLYLADTKRRGGQIVEEVNRRNEARQQAARDVADGAAEIAAEAFDWALRKEGHGNQRIFVPGKD